MIEHPSSALVWLLLSWLAAWRVTTMIRYEAGPFDLFAWLRVALVRVKLQRLVSCFHCTGVWVSAGVVLIVFGCHWMSIVIVLAVAGAVSITERALGEEVESV